MEKVRWIVVWHANGHATTIIGVKSMTISARIIGLMSMCVCACVCCIVLPLRHCTSLQTNTIDSLKLVTIREFAAVYQDRMPHNNTVWYLGVRW